MRRIEVEPRRDWREKVEACGLVWHTASGAPYWDESGAYVLDSTDVARIEQATAELYDMLIQAGDYVIDNRLLGRFGVPDWCEPLITEVWKAAPPALNYGRFDLGYDGKSPPQLFEFNCDTPTSLLEAAVVQWLWKEDVFPQNDQFNSLHDKLIAKWADIKPYLVGDRVHFAHIADAAGEDTVTTAYLMDTARAAGLDARRLTLGDIGWGRDQRFYDLDDREIRTLYKLYPWEWLVREPFGRNIAANAGRTLWIEPMWKMMWSNKAILTVLWDLFPRHPNLLWARRDGPVASSYVKKPILAREGGNVTVVRDGFPVAQSDGPYMGEAVYQGLYDLPDFGGRYPVIGSWIVDGAPAGVGIREDGLITSNLARFVPHILE